MLQRQHGVVQTAIYDKYAHNVRNQKHSQLLVQALRKHSQLLVQALQKHCVYTILRKFPCSMCVSQFCCDILHTNVLLVCFRHTRFSITPIHRECVLALYIICNCCPWYTSQSVFKIETLVQISLYFCVWCLNHNNYLCRRIFVIKTCSC